MKWISVEDNLPEIPEGNHAISVLVAEYDQVYEEITGDGYNVTIMAYDKEGFKQLHIGGKDICEWLPPADEVTHWMPLPEPPEKP